MSDGVGSAHHVVFITNQLKTLFYTLWAQKLRARGIRVSWIVTSKRWSQVVRAAGATDADIVDLWQLGPQWRLGGAPSDAQMALLGRIEQAGHNSIRTMILMDRELVRQPANIALAYTAVLGEAIDRFLSVCGADVVIGETTWAVELMSAQIARLHGARFYHPHTLRLPSDLLYFIDDIGPEPFLTWRAPDAADAQVAIETVARQNEGNNQPYYMKVIASPFQWRPHWLHEIKVAFGFDQSNAFDISVPSLQARVWRRLRWAWNAFLTTRFQRFEDATLGPDTKFVFVTLHLQPEASIDVWGAPFANQYETIAALARIVPVGTQVWVKEHRSAIGGRSLADYARLQKLPGVRLIHPNAHTPSLMRAARLVASPSGTACLEAAVMDLPAVCFGKISFGGALLQQAFDPYSLSAKDMAAFLDTADQQKMSGVLAKKALDHLALAIANSIEARVGDPVSDPQAVTDANLGKLSDIIEIACKQAQKMRAV